MELKAFLERQANTHGGYGLYEGYGDVDQTELDEGPKLS